jgi:hypothetical protein
MSTIKIQGYPGVAAQLRFIEQQPEEQGRLRVPVQVALQLTDRGAMKQLKDCLDRGLNVWEDRPQWLMDLADMLEHVK